LTERIFDIGQLDLARGTRLTPGTVQGRDTENRLLLLRESGGTMQSEDAVERGLLWLVAHQSPDGRWGTHDFNHGGNCSCKDAVFHIHNVAGTAFGLLPLLAAGNSHKYGKYSRSVAAGLAYLLQSQNEDGTFRPDIRGQLNSYSRNGHQTSGDPSDRSFYDSKHQTYEFALATVALCEAYSMTKDPALEAPVLRAIGNIIRAESPFGGWGYEPRSLVPDTSITFYNLWALRSAMNAGVYVPKDVLAPADQFLDRTTDRRKPAYWYHDATKTGVGEDTAPRPSLLPTGMASREFLGWTPEKRSLVKLARALSNTVVKEKQNIYYLFKSSHALHNYGGREWEEANAKAREYLVAAQDRGDGFSQEHCKGSWSPVDAEWMDEGGRLMSTSMALLTLEVYYANIPYYGFGAAVLNDY
jgi:hypothetical protein